MMKISKTIKRALMNSKQKCFLNVNKKQKVLECSILGRPTGLKIILKTLGKNKRRQLSFCNIKRL